MVDAMSYNEGEKKGRRERRGVVVVPLARWWQVRASLFPWRIQPWIQAPTAPLTSRCVSPF